MYAVYAVDAFDIIFYHYFYPCVEGFYFLWFVGQT